MKTLTSALFYLAIPKMPTVWFYLDVLNFASKLFFIEPPENFGFFPTYPPQYIKLASPESTAWDRKNPEQKISNWEISQANQNSNSCP